MYKGSRYRGEIEEDTSRLHRGAVLPRGNIFERCRVRDIGAGETGAWEIADGEICAWEIGAGEIGAGEIGAGASTGPWLPWAFVVEKASHAASGLESKHITQLMLHWGDWR